jgi:hypothetical protein
LIALFFWWLNRLFPSSKKGHAAIGNALMRVDAILQPSREHIIEAQEWEQGEEGKNGDPPAPGNEGEP